MEQIKKFTRLSLADRKEIERLLKSGFSGQKIARHMNRSNHCINFDIRRNGGKDFYNAEVAHKKAAERNQRKISVNLMKQDVIDELTPKVKQMHESGMTFWAIRKSLGLGYLMLLRIYRSIGIPAGNLYLYIQDIYEKLYAIQSQLEVLFELIKEKENDKTN